MPTARLAPADARATAARLVRLLADRSPMALDLGGVDLGPALEQQLFFALRDGLPAARGRGHAAAEDGMALARTGGAFALSIAPRSRPAAPSNSIVALIRDRARLTILGPIEDAMERLASERLAMVAVGRAADARRGASARTVRIQDLLTPTFVAPVVRFQLGLGGRLGSVEREWASVVDRADVPALRRVSARELPRIALGTAALQSLVARWQPSLLISFDEVGTWSRILPAVARAHGVPSLNLAHAEAAAPEAIAGADYDSFAVFGEWAAAVLREAGIPADRIVEVGAPHFDALIARPRRGQASGTSGAAGNGAAIPAGDPRRVLFAAQYVQGAMTQAGLAAGYRALLAAVAAVAPAQLVVLPHPVQPAGQIESIVAAAPAPSGVVVRVEQRLGLHDVLDDAWLLATAWSNSVFEAAIRGVPALLIDVMAASPVAYAAEGLGIGATSEAAALDATRALLDPGFRAAAVARSAAALARHLGPLDGGASDRTARLVLSMAGRNVAPPA